MKTPFNVQIRVYGRVNPRRHPDYYTGWTPKKDEDSWVVVNTTSKSGQEWSRELSPMILEGLKVQDREGKEITTTSLEAAWQFSKVWNAISYPGRSVTHWDRTKREPTRAWWNHAELGWLFSGYHWKDESFKKYKSSLRRPAKNAKIHCIWWKGKPLSMVEERKEVYCKGYAENVVKTEAFKQLKKWKDKGVRIALFDLDGIDHFGLNKTWEELLNDENKSFGHASVLHILLMGEDPSELRVYEENSYEYKAKENLNPYEEAENNIIKDAWPPFDYSL